MTAIRLDLALKARKEIPWLNEQLPVINRMLRRMEKNGHDCLPPWYNNNRIETRCRNCYELARMCRDVTVGKLHNTICPNAPEKPKEEDNGLTKAEELLKQKEETMLKENSKGIRWSEDDIQLAASLLPLHRILSRVEIEKILENEVTPVQIHGLLTNMRSKNLIRVIGKSKNTRYQRIMAFPGEPEIALPTEPEKEIMVATVEEVIIQAEVKGLHEKVKAARNALVTLTFDQAGVASNVIVDIITKLDGILEHKEEKE